MVFSLKNWAKLHTVDAVTLRKRWASNPEGNFTEDLLADGRFDEAKGVWRVKSELELHRLVGALQWHNPTMKLWFRGESSHYLKALPSRSRIMATDDDSTPSGVAWLDARAQIDRAIRDRSPLARAAILQHYGCPTSFLDVSASFEIACAFAFASVVKGQAHLRVYALPRHQQAVTIFDTADVVLVDLCSELPSFCARPHVQQAAFIARREAVHNDIAGYRSVDPEQAEVDPFCIAHIRLDFDGRTRFYESRRNAGVLYPKEGKGCRVCEKPADMNGDYLLHILGCYARRYPEGKPERFPDNLAAA